MDPKLDQEGNPVLVVRPSPNELVSRVLITKPDKIDNMKRARSLKKILLQVRTPAMMRTCSILLSWIMLKEKQQRRQRVLEI